MILALFITTREDKERALKYYEKAVELNPENINFQKNLADFYFVELGRTEDAIQIYIKVLATHPEDIEALLAIGKFCVTVGKIEEASIFCNRVLENDPQNNDVLKIIDLLNNQNKVMTVEKADAIAIEAVNKSEGYIVSAIVSAYNSEKFMRGKLDDLLNQTLADRIEIIVIDSNSPENEGAIIREYMAKHRNIRYLRTEKRETVYQAWNRGIAMASGEFITNANTDDRLRRDSIEVLVRALCENPNKVLSYGDSIITLQENETFEQCTPHGYLRWPDFDRAKLLEFCFVGPHPVWRKSVHDEAGYFDVNFRCAADYEFWLRLAMNHDFVHVPELLGLYWQNEDTVSRKGDVPLIEAARIQQAYRSKYDRLSSGCQTGNIQKAPLPDRQIADLLIPDRGKPDSAGFAIKSVLYVVHGFPPAAVGGVEVYTQNLAKEMTSRGIRVTVLYPTTDSSGPLYAITSDTIDGLTLAKFHVPPGNLFTSVISHDLDSAFASFLKSHTFELVHFQHVFYNMSLSMISVAKKAAIPVAITLHDFWYICPRVQLFIENNTSVCSGPENPAKCSNCLFDFAWYPGISHADFEHAITIRQAYVRKILLEVDLLFAPSHFVADIFARHGFGCDKIAVAPLGIGKFSVQRSTAGVGPIFGYMGTIHPVKNVMRLVAAFAATHGQARLDMYGGGEDFRISMLKDSIHDSRIVYHGSYTPEQLPEILSRMDVLVVPSLIESYCLTAREALSAGIPVLAARVGGIPEILRNGVNGMLFDPFDTASLIRLLQQFISDPGMLQTMNGKALPVMNIAGDARFLLEQYASRMKSRDLNLIEPELKTKVVSDAQQTGISHQHPLIQSQKKIGVAVFSFDLKEHACGNYRIQAPLKEIAGEVKFSWGVEPMEKTFNIIPGVAEVADIIVVQRFFPQPDTAGFLDDLCSLGKPIIFEIDDLLTQLPTTNPHYSSGMYHAPHIYEFIRKCSAVTVTTEELKKHFSSYNDNIHILPNLLDSDLWCNTSPPSSGPVVIGYAGTITHVADLELLEDVLGRIASRYGNKVAFTFLGCTTKRISKLPGFSYIKFDTTFETYARKLQKTPIDIMLAPLEDNPFNRCKSNIKWMEYSSCGIAGVYADLPPYNSCIKRGVTGLLARSEPKQWFNAIDLLMKNTELRRSISLEARHQVMSKYTLKVGAHRWLQAYREIISLQATRNTASTGNLTVPSKIDAQYSGAPRRKKFSIMIMTWNRSTMLDLCLKSLFKNLLARDECEIIIGDNGSSEATAEVISRYQIDKYIRKNSNIGLELYHELFDLAQGEYLIDLDDDVLDLPFGFEQKFEEYFAAFPDYGLLGLDVVQNEHTNGAKPDKTNYREDVRGNLTIEEGVTGGWCLCLKRLTFEQIGKLGDVVLNMAQSEDGVLWKRVQAYGLRAGIIKDLKCFHASGPHFSREYGYLERDTEKYAISGLSSFVAAYANYGSKAIAPATPDPLISIVIPLFNRIDYTKKCIEAIQTTVSKETIYELILVDNNSNDATGEYIKSLGNQVHVITNSTNMGFAKACNQGASAAKGSYVLFLNNDTEPNPGWIEALVQVLKVDETVAAVGSKLIYPDDTIQHAGIVMVNDRKNTDPLLARNNHVGKPEDSPEANTPFLYQALTAACILIRKSAFKKAGGFDEKYWNGYEDVDLCFKLQEQGGILVYQPASVVIHHESRSGPERFAKARDNIARLHKNWLGKIKPDFILNEDGAVTSTDAGKIRPYYTPGLPQPTDINGIHLLSRYAVKTADRPNTGDKDMLAVEQVYEAMQPVLLASRPEDAVRALENIVRSFPNFARAHSDLGMLYYQSREKQKAVAHYERAATISPENADFQKNLADYYYVEMARAEDALKLYSKVLQARPKDVETLMTAGHILVSLQRFDEADAYYRKVLEIEPWNTAANEIHNKLSQKSRGGNGSKKAEDMYAEVKRLLDLNDQAGARRALEKMLGVCPHFALAHNDLAVLCYQSGDKDQALRHYEEAVRLQPENSIFQKNLGDFYCIEQGRIEDALRIYVRILETQPKDIETLMATGHICSSLSRWDDARTFYRRVLEIEPWKMEARKQLDGLENATTGAASLQFAPSAQDMYAEAARLVSAGSVQAGKDRLAELVKRHPGFALAHNDLGVLAYRAEDNQSALLSYQTATRLEPGNLTFKKNLADLYWKELGRIEDALKIYVDIMAAHPEDVETLLATGKICLSLRQPNDARVFFDRVLKIEPWNAEAHQQLRAV